jgi:hypothetical protein
MYDIDLVGCITRDNININNIKKYTNIGGIANLFRVIQKMDNIKVHMSATYGLDGNSIQQFCWNNNVAPKHVISTHRLCYHQTRRYTVDIINGEKQNETCNIEYGKDILIYNSTIHAKHRHFAYADLCINHEDFHNFGGTTSVDLIKQTVSLDFLQRQTFVFISEEVLNKSLSNFVIHSPTSVRYNKKVFPVQKKLYKDVLGAGDTFASYFIESYIKLGKPDIPYTIKKTQDWLDEKNKEYL